MSCGQIIPRGVREQYDHCLVLHASQLPEGRGWSPHIWQVLEGRDSLTVSLLEAEDAVDTGDIWQRLTIPLDGTELLDEINEKVFEAELALMEWAILHYHTVVPEPQVGLPTYYRRRTPADNEIDPEQSLLALMPTLRVSDADRYPAFFYYRGQKYRLHLTKVEPSE
ncbi:MAG: formyltransferase family protein [Saccharospirillum sp.]